LALVLEDGEDEDDAGHNKLSTLEATSVDVQQADDMKHGRL